jgi:hypothetical protein
MSLVELSFGGYDGINDCRSHPYALAEWENPVEWRIEDRFYLNIEDPKLNGWVVYNQFGKWSAAVFDRVLEATVFERQEADVETAKRAVEGFISRYYSKEISPDRWMEALSPRSVLELPSEISMLDPECSKDLSLS